MRTYFILMAVFLAGCTSSLSRQVTSITNQYEALRFDDGITLQEAKVIAQRALIKQNLAKIYDLENPKLYKDVTDLPNYEDYWFIAFEEKKVVNLEFVFMAIIDKHKGKIKFADDYKEGKNWILEAALRRD